ncbi:hypothetical protein [Staphylococcus kloosii]|jgi:hypothetical protein|uniref:Uncharacterized protein n=2 Tax=Staphylococcus kloosii TaxID=29384 RepID=A0ABQ0XJY9_9STAP|nr:hypothetical protein [Staphylococcus kloosii]AVQ36222.1 hypothetical protein C7J89_08765 [Staphylococcus kloosii]PNZ03343.1 hypothetical protein CD136_10710 [Staphylococcus kloosii]GEP81736.1 hypothetical protein SKL01_09140 [Staphylococcus kloosii]SUM49304.1 Uncharacterised protein [Staphylococcus kloosii]
MKFAKVLSIVCTVLLVGVLVYGVIMMIGDFMGITTFNNQLLVVGIALVLLSDLVQRSQKLLSIILLIAGIVLIFIG